jgi:hypothetical protein
MILTQTDSILQIADSATAIVAKPMVLKDTVVATTHNWSLIDATKSVIQTWLSQDSTKIADSFTHKLPIPSGFVGIPHPLLPQNEIWVFIVLSALFFMVAFSISQSSGIWTELTKPFFQITDRSSLFSKKTISDIRLRFFLILFSIGVISLFAYTRLYSSSSEFTFLKFGYFFIVTALFFGIKSLSIDLVGNVFVDQKSMKIAKESYTNIISFLGITLYPLLLIQIYQGTQYLHIITLIGTLCCITGVILVTIKLFQLFFHKLVASFYIMLYLCTLEILPLILLYWVYIKL